ncbi:murein transglycosylase A [Pseudooceanicola algae]|uniref:murein transglycosylase A n=1 Tax=Pseudooceanicola algae TaxID=1537215 RepID=UPI001E5087B2|nr:MltA domain-containing protein [Pseudooceanicola algae]
MPVPLDLPAEPAPELTYSVLTFADLPGWAGDDHLAALTVFLKTCGDLREADWAAICALGRKQAESPRSARAFFELVFTPVLIQDGAPMVFTGYYEPELAGSRDWDVHYPYPVYALPPEAPSGESWLTRAEIETTGALKHRGLEIGYVGDPVALMFLQIQGSGRITLEDGRQIRLGYAGHNGHDYRSIGQEMVRRGIYDASQVSAPVISNWVRRHPVEGAELLRTNPSYVFFREITDAKPDDGPRGAMNRALSAGRSLAVDPRYVPLGAPVWIEKKGFRAMRRLMVAQDTGSAIKGPQRADVFTGTGRAAGREAQRMRDTGRMVVLLPIQRAYAMLEEGSAL